MGYGRRWDVAWQSSGEIVTAEKLRTIGTATRDSVLDLLGDLWRGYSGAKRSGVVNGLDVTPASANMTLTVGRGLAFRYNVLLDVLGALAIEPIVLEANRNVVLPNPDPSNPRYDLIVARPSQGYSDYATRSVRQPDGTLTTQSLPGWWAVDAELVVIQGTPASVPSCPNAQLGDVVLAAVYVTPGAPHTIPNDCIIDLRWWLPVCAWGDISEYRLRVKRTESGNYNYQQYTTDPALRPLASPTHGNTGVFIVYIGWPSALGRHPSELYDISGDPPICAVGTLGNCNGQLATMEIMWQTGSVSEYGGALTEALVRIYTRDFSGALADPPTGGSFYIRVGFKRGD